MNFCFFLTSDGSWWFCAANVKPKCYNPFSEQSKDVRFSRLFPDGSRGGLSSLKKKRAKPSEGSTTHFRPEPSTSDTRGSRGTLHSDLHLQLPLESAVLAGASGAVCKALKVEAISSEMPEIP